MSFTLFLQSTKGTQETANTNTVLNFDFLWNATPFHDGEYEVSFSFMTRAAQLANPTVNDIVFLNATWGAYSNTFMSNNDRQQQTLLGLARPTYLGNASGGYACTLQDNVPIRISGKPTQNQFKVTIQDIFGNLFANAGSTQNMFMIHFKALSRIPQQITPKIGSFSLQLNSREGTSVGPGAAINGNVNFNIDWANLSAHKGRFEMTSAFSSQAMANNLTVFSTIRLEMDCFSTPTYLVEPDGVTSGAQLTKTIGMFRPAILGIGGQYAFNARDNPPIIINILPSKNEFMVSMLTLAGGNTGNFTGNWELTLFFKAI